MSSLTEDELLAKQRKGARITALIVGFVALGIFVFTLYVNR
jgi:hypothetical protein